MNLGCSFFNEKKGKDVVDEEGIFRGLLEQILFLGVDLARIRVIKQIHWTIVHSHYFGGMS